MIQTKWGHPGLFFQLNEATWDSQRGTGRRTVSLTHKDYKKDKLLCLRGNFTLIDNSNEDKMENDYKIFFEIIVISLQIL